MRVISAVNGLITSESVALYALKYAKVYRYTLILLHVLNGEDSEDEVKKSMENIEEIAKEYEVKTERVFLEGTPISTIREYIENTNNIDTLFCATRIRKRFFSHSFSEKLTRTKLPINIAVFRIVHVNSALLTENIVMPIKSSRLSIKKFTFFASMVKAYEAKSEIYSVTVVNRWKWHDIDISATKERLEKINSKLYHYIKLFKLINLHLHIKHAFSQNEAEQVLHHLSHHNFDLMVIGGQRLSTFSRLLGEKPIEVILKHSPINTVAFYPKKEK